MFDNNSSDVSINNYHTPRVKVNASTCFHIKHGEFKQAKQYKLFNKTQVELIINSQWKCSAKKCCNPLISYQLEAGEQYCKKEKHT